LPEDRFIRCAQMPSYVLGPVAGAGVRPYWSSAGVADARTPQDQGPLTFGHRQPLDHDAIATSSGMSGTTAASQPRHQLVTLSCIDRQLNCTTPRTLTALITYIVINVYSDLIS